MNPLISSSAQNLKTSEYWAMKRLLLLLALPAIAAPSKAEPPSITCPGQTTYEMRACASKRWEQSTQELKSRLTKDSMQRWQQATQEACAIAYAPYKQGTIYPQLVVGCDDNLNRALLKEFRGLGD